MTIIVTRTGEGRTFVLGENTAEAARQRMLAEQAVLDAAAAGAEQVTLANSAAASAAGTLVQASVYLFPLALPNDGGLKNLIELKLYEKTNQGEIIAWPANLHVKQISADASDRFRFRLAGGATADGSGRYPQIAAESTNADDQLATPVQSGTLSRAYGGLTGNDDLALYASNTSLGVPKNAQIGTYRINFAAAPFGTYFSLYYSYAEAALQRARVLLNDTEKRRIKVISRLAAAEDAATAFVSIKDPYLNSWLKSVRLFGIKPNNAIKVEAYQTGATTLRITFTDKVNGNYIASYNKAYDYTARPSKIFLDPRGNGGNIGIGTAIYTGMYGVVELNTAALVPGGLLQQAAAIGDNTLKLDKCMTREQVRKAFRDAGENPRAAQEIVVPTTNANPTQNADTTLQTTLNGLYLEGPYAVPSDLAVRWCIDAMPDTPLGLALMPGHHVLSNAYWPHNVWFYPAIPGTLVTIGVRDNGIVRPTNQVHNTHKIWGITFIADNVQPPGYAPNATDSAQYPFHRDNANEFVVLDEFGELNWWNGMDLFDCVFEGDEAHNWSLIGMGTNAGADDRIERVWVKSKNPNRAAPLIASHTNATGAVEGRLTIRNCRADPLPATTATVAVQSIQPNTKPCTLVIENCPTFTLVNSSGTVAGGWIGVGDYEGPVENTGSNGYLEFSTVGSFINGTGATMTAKTAVSAVGNVATLAQDGDRVDGIALADVPAGALGKFIVARKVHSDKAPVLPTGLVYVSNGVLTDVAQASGRPVGRLKGKTLTLKTV